MVSVLEGSREQAWPGREFGKSALVLFRRLTQHGLDPEGDVVAWTVSGLQADLISRFRPQAQFGGTLQLVFIEDRGTHLLRCLTVKSQQRQANGIQGNRIGGGGHNAGLCNLP